MRQARYASLSQWVTARACSVLWPCLVLTGHAVATVVTINAHNQEGLAAVDTIVVLDPLDATPAPSHERAVIDQVDKQFIPKVSVLRTGTAVTFPNSDRIRHQVYSFSLPKKFNLKLYAGAPPVDVIFDKPGLVVLGCNIHDAMLAFVGVVDSPYFVKIGKSGAADLTVPPGRYRVRAWNPDSDIKSPPPMTIGNDPLTIALIATVDPSRDAVTAWPE